MQSASKGNQTYSYTYNSDGLRASKTVGNTTYHYYWNSGKLIAMTYDDHYMIFTYTESGTPFSVTCYDAYLDREYECLYITNLQGDVVGIYDAAKSSMVISYTYDAWGRLVGKDGTSSDYSQLEMNNPLLYRGYQYDYETGFYYLQSRYYDPSVGRFLNADDTAFLGASGTLLSWNLFAYCENNVVNGSDPFGLFRINTQVAGAIIDLLVVVILPYLFTAFKATKLVAWAKATRWFRKIYDKAIKALSLILYNAMDLLLYSIAGKAANAATRAFTLSNIQTWIGNILSFSIGYGIAWIIDCLDKDGRSGYIVF